MIYYIIQQEPEPFDLDDLNNEATEPKTPRLSNISFTRPKDIADSAEETIAEQEEAHKSSPSNFLGRTAQLSKAVVRAAVETQSEKETQFVDKLVGARNVAQHAMDSLSVDSLTGMWSKTNSTGTKKDKGDEALPPMNDDEGKPPDVRYTKGQ